jgi:hypothetical protein
MFVSHDLGAIQRLCPRSIWLEEGRIAADGPSTEVVDAYLALHAPSNFAVELPTHQDGSILIESIAITDEANVPMEPRCDEPFTIRVRLRAREWIPDLDAAIYVVDADGSRVLHETWQETAGRLPPWEQDQRLEASVQVPGVLAPGEYVVGVWLASEEECIFYQEVLTFRLRERRNDLSASIENKRIIRSPTGLGIRSL